MLERALRCNVSLGGVWCRRLFGGYICCCEWGIGLNGGQTTFAPFRMARASKSRG